MTRQDILAALTVERYGHHDDLEVERWTRPRPVIHDTPTDFHERHRALWDAYAIITREDHAA